MLTHGLSIGLPLVRGARMGLQGTSRWGHIVGPWGYHGSTTGLYFIVLAQESPMGTPAGIWYCGFHLVYSIFPWVAHDIIVLVYGTPMGSP